ncbi:MAG: DUF5661 family protein [Candidatus Kariarchaeaceae archaeon]|jgi:predicted transcriptional regulator
MKLFEIKEKLPDVKTLSPEELAKKHGVSLKKIKAQVKKGTKEELEHTKDRIKAREIALDHLKELPDYYDKLEKIEEATYNEPTLWVIVEEEYKEDANVIGPFSSKQQAEEFIKEIKEGEGWLGKLTVQAIESPRDLIKYIQWEEAGGPDSDEEFPWRYGG